MNILLTQEQAWNIYRLQLIFICVCCFMVPNQLKYLFFILLYIRIHFTKKTYDKNHRKSISRIARFSFQIYYRIQIFKYSENINRLTLYKRNLGLFGQLFKRFIDCSSFSLKMIVIVSFFVKRVQGLFDWPFPLNILL